MTLKNHWRHADPYKLILPDQKCRAIFSSWDLLFAILLDRQRQL